MRIKTIVERIDDVRKFDRKVNEALERGYVITKREVIMPGQPIRNDAYFHTLLYAELTLGEGKK